MTKTNGKLFNKILNYSEEEFLDTIHNKMYINREIDEGHLSKSEFEKLKKSIPEKSSLFYQSDSVYLSLFADKRCNERQLSESPSGKEIMGLMATEDSKLYKSIIEESKLIIEDKIRENDRELNSLSENSFKKDYYKEQVKKWEEEAKHVEELPSFEEFTSKGYYNSSCKYICRINKEGEVLKVLANHTNGLGTHPKLARNLDDVELYFDDYYGHLCPKNKDEFYKGGRISLLGFNNKKPVICINGSSDTYGGANHEKVKEFLEKDGLEAVILTR